MGFDTLLGDYMALGTSTVLRHGECAGLARLACTPCAVRDRMRDVAEQLSTRRQVPVTPGDVSRTLIAEQSAARRIDARADHTIAGARLLTDGALRLLAASGAIDLREALEQPQPVMSALLHALALHDGTIYSERLPEQLARLRQGTFSQLPRPPRELLASLAGAFAKLSGSEAAFRVLFSALGAARHQAHGDEGELLSAEALATLHGIGDDEVAAAVVLLVSRLAEFARVPGDSLARARPLSLAPRCARPAQSASAASRAAASRRTAAVTTARESLLQLACSDSSLQQLRPLLTVSAFTDARTQRFAVRLLLRLQTTDSAIGATGATAAATLQQLIVLVADPVCLLPLGCLKIPP